jgi:hypothetical protein
MTDKFSIVLFSVNLLTLFKFTNSSHHCYDLRSSKLWAIPFSILKLLVLAFRKLNFEY